ncbi:hypothetical protein BB560_000637 [Smittium megazygosporum]|uniref:Uncharacterized protein n=1 Tax=Smittium megazygosporum TaxID=133381 RepID=A0A2T9ZK01_9FUNG|nr:hypothetical protein BB560_000637 [Smittium megazygosporum]
MEWPRSADSSSSILHISKDIHPKSNEAKSSASVQQIHKHETSPTIRSNIINLEKDIDTHLNTQLEYPYSMSKDYFSNNKVEIVCKDKKDPKIGRTSTTNTNKSKERYRGRNSRWIVSVAGYLLTSTIVVDSMFFTGSWFVKEGQDPDTQKDKRYGDVTLESKLGIGFFNFSILFSLSINAAVIAIAVEFIQFILQAKIKRRSLKKNRKPFEESTFLGKRIKTVVYQIDRKITKYSAKKNPQVNRGARYSSLDTYSIKQEDPNKYNPEHNINGKNVSPSKTVIDIDYSL